MGSIQGHGDDKYATGKRLASSAHLGWDDILVERWVHAPGDMNDTKPGVTEIIVMLAGSIKVRRRGDGRLQNHQAKPGTIWLCPAGIQEDLIKVEGTSFDAVHMFLPAQLLSKTVLEEFDLDPNTAQLQYDGGFYDPLIAQLGIAIARELENPMDGSNLVVENLKTALSAYVIRQHSSVTQRLPSERTTGALDQRRLKRVKNFIHENIGQNLTLAELAIQADLSPYHFSRAFKLATGSTPHTYVLQERVNRAKSLLRQRTKSLEHIAQLCGFSSQSQMARVFSKLLGTTPGVLRKSG